MRRLLVILVFLLAPLSASAQGLSVFAAASLTDVMKDISAAWVAQGHPALRLNLAASSTLARQIEQGAEANIFASADEQWMNTVEKQGLLAAGTRHTLLGNDLVLVEPKDTLRPETIGPGWNLQALLGPSGRLAVGDPSNVPAGIYARQALTRLGVWDFAQTRLASSDSVRSALLLVERGEAPAGIVYSTDAAVAPGVAVAGVFPDSTHDPVTYPFAVLRAGDTPEARALLAFLEGPQAAALFTKRGFKTE